MSLFHRHKFVPFRTQLMQLAVINYATDKITPTRTVTNISETCRCGEKRLREMDGEWTLESLGWHLQEVMFDQYSDKPRFVLSQEPVKGELGRLVWVKAKVGL